MLTDNVAKVQGFIKGNKNVTAREVSGGTGLALEIVEAILAAVVSAGEVSKEGVANTARYNLVGVSSVPVVETPADFRTTEQRWSDQARRQGLEEFARLHPEPKPEPRYQPTAAELDAELAKRPKVVLTPEERQQLKLVENYKGGVNPQAHIAK